VFSAVYAFYLCLPFAFTAFFTVDDDRFKTICEILFSVGILLALWPTSPEARLTLLIFPAVLPFAALAYTNAITFKLYFRIPQIHNSATRRA